MVVGEEVAVGAVRRVWRMGFKTCTTVLNGRVSKGFCKSREGFREWSDGYILGFFERGLLAAARMATRGFLGCLIV